MAKQISSSTTVTPMFEMARTMLDEIDQNTAAWLDQGFAQAAELQRIAKTLREQSSGITRAWLATAEQLTLGAFDAAAAWTKQGVGA